MDALRSNIRESLANSAATQSDRDLRTLAIEEILKSYDFPVPETLVERQASDLLRDLAYQMLRSGVPPQSIREINWEERRGEARTRAVRDVRAALVFELIGEAEKISVDEDELDAEIANIAAASGEAVEAVKARLTKDEALSSIENRLRHQKTLDAIIKSADVTIKEVAEAEAAQSKAPDTPQPEQSPEQA